MMYLNCKFQPNTDISTIFDEDVHIIQDENNAPTILKRDAIDHGEDEDIMLVDELLVCHCR